MKYIYLCSFLLAILLSSCQSTKKEKDNIGQDTTQASSAPVALKLKWESDTLLTTCESVLYDKERDVLYVSNINGAPDAKDGNGFISKVSLDGKIMEAQWIKGLDAPKGMGLANGKLYVTDIDKIIEIDIAAGKITKSYPVEGAKFLNDITVDASGKVYASDSGAGNIVTIENGKIVKWLEGVDGPNGLLVEGNTMLMALWNAKTLNTIDMATKAVTLQISDIENPDGIEAIGDGGYLVSSWNGLVHHIGSDWKKALILDTQADSASAADIEYIQDKNLLLVPTFFKNTVAAYELSK